MNTVLEPGTLVGQRFVVQGAAGHGGMGTVYRGRDMLRDETVAIKLLAGNFVRSDDNERFAREVQILAELCHPGIVSYVAHGVIGNGQPYLVMEWLQGEELAQRMHRSVMTLQESLSLIRHVAEALDVAHRQHIVHRDLKPSTVITKGNRASNDPQRFEMLANEGLGSGSIFPATGRHLVYSRAVLTLARHLKSGSDQRPIAGIGGRGLVVPGKKERHPALNEAAPGTAPIAPGGRRCAQEQ